MGYDLDSAFDDLNDLRLIWTSVLPSWSDHQRARTVIDRFSLFFWDALIVATCIENRIEELLTEDFDAYQDIDGLRISNPFLKRR